MSDANPLPDAILAPIGPRPLAGEIVFNSLRQAIISLALPPGMPLSRAQLATRLGVSQTPVREALTRLQEEGLVAVVPSASTHVARIDLDHARQTHFMRLALELELVRGLAKAPSPDLAEQLHAVLARQRALIGQEGFAAEDDAFHALLYDAGQMAGLWALLRSRSGHLDRLRRMNLPAPGKMETVVVEHQRIVDALLAQDLPGAEAAVRQHFSAAFSRLPQVRDRFPDYFVPGPIGVTPAG